VFEVLLSLYCRLQALRNERGATAVEYGIMVALIAAAIVATVTILGDQLNTVFTGVAEKLGYVAP
jgi:pilus assembly protein Flp/PilA